MPIARAALPRDPVAWTIFVGLACLSVMLVSAVVARSEFVIDEVTWIVLLALLYPFRAKLIHSVAGGVFGLLTILMNASGVYGTYDIYPFGLGWDKLIHLVAGIGLTLLTYGYLRKRQLRFAELLIISYLVVSGMTAMEEVIEFLGYNIGIKQGMYGMQNGSKHRDSPLERFDTQWDLVFDSIGICLAVVAVAATRKRT